VRARSSKPSTASTCSSPSRSSVIMPRTTLWWRMSVASTRCIAAFRFSVPESAWLTSSSVERRRASRAAVRGIGSGVWQAGMRWSPPFVRWDAVSAVTWGRSTTWSDVSTVRLHVSGPAAGGVPTVPQSYRICRNTPYHTRIIVDRSRAPPHSNGFRGRRTGGSGARQNRHASAGAGPGVRRNAADARDRQRMYRERSSFLTMSASIRST
jgi:hypothetical protein